MRLLEETRRQPLLGVPKMKRRDARPSNPGAAARAAWCARGKGGGNALFGFPEQHLPLLESTTK